MCARMSEAEASKTTEEMQNCFTCVHAFFFCEMFCAVINRIFGVGVNATFLGF